MTIRILSDSIKIGPYTLSEANNGLSFDGAVRTLGNLSSNYVGGTVGGFVSGGFQFGPWTNQIQSFPFATATTNTTDYADLTVGRYHCCGQSSSTHGYTSAGQSSLSNIIDKFPFASASNATDVGDLTQQMIGTAPHQSASHGYTSGGERVSPPLTVQNTIQRFPFAADANATNVGTLAAISRYAAGMSSSSKGYSVAGMPGYNTVGSSFPFASTSVTSTNTITMTINRQLWSTGFSSGTHGYVTGGDSSPSPGYINVIDKFPFASEGSASDVGDLLRGSRAAAPVSSEGFGYRCGGLYNPPGLGVQNVIQRFPFASDSNASDVGDLAAILYYAAGQQV